MRELATAETRTLVAAAVGDIEKTTSAEIVVVLRATSGHYRAADLAFGALLALILLCVFLYHPAEFDFTWFPLEQAGAFLSGVLLCASSPPLRRLLTPRSVRRVNVVKAARALFVERGVSKTRARTGMLVYLSAFERDAEVVADVGLDAELLGAPYLAAVERLRAASARGGRDELLAGLTDLGGALAKPYPCGNDDIDELPNEVAA